MTDFVPGTESVWQLPPYEIHVGQGKYGWEYYVYLDDEDFMEADDFEDEDEALRAAMAMLDEVELWRKPDYEVGGYALWWDPAERLYDAEHVTEVSAGCVSEYSFVGGYEGFEDDQWLKITVCPDDAPSGHNRAIVDVGVRHISEHGGEEEILSTEEVQGEWPDITREPESNPTLVKQRMLNPCGYSR